MQELHTVIGALRVGGVIIYPLLALAVVATVVILEKGFVFVARARLPASALPMPSCARRPDESISAMNL